MDRPSDVHAFHLGLHVSGNHNAATQEKLTGNSLCGVVDTEWARDLCDALRRGDGEQGELRFNE